ncbi:MAG: transcriptional repressor, partial [Thermodesulfobacteriota bacterium]
VYNTVEALRDRGELTELTIDSERKHYDPNCENHHHIICSGCNKIGDVFEDYSESLNLPEELLNDFNITGNHVNFYGVCKECATVN